MDKLKVIFYNSKIPTEHHYLQELIKDDVNVFIIDWVNWLAIVLIKLCEKKN